MAYLPLSTANLPDPAIDPAQDKEPQDYFDTFLYTGNGGGLQVGDVIKKPADTITINNSLLFNDDDAAYLSKTDFGTSTNTAKRTFSTWIKSCDQSYTTYDHIISAGASSIDGFGFSSDGKLQVLRGGTEVDTGNQSIKDPSRWYHVMLTWDSTAGEWYMYINGVLDATGVASGALSKIGQSGQTNTIMKRSNATQYIHGYLAETVFLDGYIGSVTDFGEFDANGIWIPKDISTAGLTYGTNGFYLNYADSSDLGKDVSGQGNHWTSNNLATTDQVSDSPTNNCALHLDPSTATTHTISEGNLKTTNTSGTHGGAVCNRAYFSGKWYHEVKILAETSDKGQGVGIGNRVTRSTTDWGNYVGLIAYLSDGTVLTSGGYSAFGNAHNTNDIIGVAYDHDARTLEFFHNGISQGTLTESDFPSTIDWDNIAPLAFGRNVTQEFNFGQRTLDYTPPTGYVTMTEDNITVDDQNLESPDLVWIKNRDAADSHQLYDSVRGVQKVLISDDTPAEDDAPNGLLDFNANGFTIGSQNEVNTSGEDYVAWCWKANGSGSTIAAGSIDGTDPTIASQVSANTESGFSIVSYSGATDGSTVGHGLNQAPELVIFKNRDISSGWFVMGYPTNPNFTADGSYLLLDGTSAMQDSGGNEIEIGSSVITLVDAGSSIGGANSLTDRIIAYCFHSVEGYSKFGSYTGATNGVFVYLGFRPAFVMIKNTGSSSWWMMDSKRDTYNVMDDYLIADNTTVGTYTSLDFLSNGFRTRNTSSSFNTNGATHIYMAFAETPFKYSLAR